MGVILRLCLRPFFHFSWYTLSPMGCYPLTQFYLHLPAGNSEISLQVRLLSQLHTCIPKGLLEALQTPESLPAPSKNLHLLQTAPSPEFHISEMAHLVPQGRILADSLILHI